MTGFSVGCRVLDGFLVLVGFTVGLRVLIGLDVGLLVFVGFGVFVGFLVGLRVGLGVVGLIVGLVTGRSVGRFVLGFSATGRLVLIGLFVGRLEYGFPPAGFLDGLLDGRLFGLLVGLLVFLMGRQLQGFVAFEDFPPILLLPFLSLLALLFLYLSPLPLFPR